MCSPWGVRRGIVHDKPVASPPIAPPPILECRKMSASDECPPVRRRSEVRRWPVESPPRTNATRTNTRRTPHRTRPNDERTQNEQLTNTHPPARQASLERTMAVASPCEVRDLSVARPSGARLSSVRSPWQVCKKPVACPCAVRILSVVGLAKSGFGGVADGRWLSRRCRIGYCIVSMVLI